MRRPQIKNGMDQCLVAVMAGVLAGILVTVGGCAGDPPKPAPTVTPDQVHGNAEKAFEKLKQDERNRPTSPY